GSTRKGTRRTPTNARCRCDGALVDRLLSRLGLATHLGRKRGHPIVSGCAQGADREGESCGGVSGWPVESESNPLRGSDVVSEDQARRSREAARVLSRPGPFVATAHQRSLAAGNRRGLEPACAACTLPTLP